MSKAPDSSPYTILGNCKENKLTNKGKHLLGVSIAPKTEGTGRELSAFGGGVCDLLVVGISKVLQKEKMK